MQLTPEEEKRRKEVIKIYEEAKAEAAKEEKKKVGNTCALPSCCSNLSPLKQRRCTIRMVSLS